MKLNKKMVKGKPLVQQEYELKEKEVVENMDVKEAKESNDLLGIYTEMANIHRECKKEFKKDQID